MLLKELFQRERPRRPRGHHPGQPAHALPERLEHLEDLLSIRAALGRRVLRPVQVEGHGEHVVAAEPGLHLLQLGEAAQHEGGADQEHERERELGDGEYGAQPLARAPRGRTPVAGEGAGQPLERGQPRERAHQQAREHGGGEREREHPAVDADLGRTGSEAGRELDERVAGQERDRQAQEATQ